MLSEACDMARDHLRAEHGPRLELIAAHRTVWVRWYVTVKSAHGRHLGYVKALRDGGRWHPYVWIFSEEFMREIALPSTSTRDDALDEILHAHGLRSTRGCWLSPEHGRVQMIKDAGPGAREPE